MNARPAAPRPVAAMTRAVAATLAVVATAASLVVLATTPAPAAQAGTLTVTPATGQGATVSTFTTSGVCPDGDTVRIKVFGGSGAGAIASPTTINSPKNMNGAIDAAGVRTPSGTQMEILASQTWVDFATGGSPSLSILSGTYTVRAWCSSGDWFDGSITVAGSSLSALTYTTSAGTTSAPPSSTSPAPTSSSPKPTTSSPAPTSTSPAPTTSSPAPTSSSPLPTTSSPAPTSASPSPTLTQTATPSPTVTVTPSPTSPVENVGIAVGPDGSFLSPGATLAAGDNVTMFGRGFQPGALVKFSIFSQEVVLGYGYADANGAITYNYVIPDLPKGTHKLAMSGATRIVVFPFTMGTTAAGSGSTPTPQASGTSTGSSSDVGDSLAGTGGSGSVVLTLGLVGALLLLVGGHVMLSGGTPAPAVGQAASASRGRHSSRPRPARTSRRSKGRHA